MPYNLLSEPIRKYIRSKGWEALRPIQGAAIIRIINTDNNYIIASRTSSGKTEAAFLPILTKVNFNNKGVQVLYISPLIALINDQFYRIEELCKNLEIPVNKWHGEAKRSLKSKLLKNPQGIVLITPESLEAMFVNKPYNISHLLGNLQYIVIDEIHSFLGTDRGLQLMSIISRIQQVNKDRIKIIGLSATIGTDNYAEAKRLTGDFDKTKILLDKSKKDTDAKFKYFECASSLSLNLLKDLYKETFENKVLIFPNSRGRTEEVSVKLRKISDKAKGHKFYFSHHSSVDKEIRESIEHFAKNNKRFNFCISCTSTLELGIDIGAVDKIVQIDSTHSVSSLVQRIGRSGRKEGEKSIVSLYATDKWSLLQSLACWSLYKKSFIEPISPILKPYDIFFHQVLSIVKQLSGCSQKDLLKRININKTFENIEAVEKIDLIENFIKLDYLEKIREELIIGIKGESIVNSREFYSVFPNTNDFKVLHAGRKIGNIPFSPQIIADENILLAAKIWTITNVDFRGSKIFVIPAKDGKKPLFFGKAGGVHNKVKEEMLRILKSKESYPELNEESKNVISEMQFDFSNFQINDFEVDRPLIDKEDKIRIYTFTGSKINRSIEILFALIGVSYSIEDHGNSIELNIKKDSLKDTINNIRSEYNNIDEYLVDKLTKNIATIAFSKWGKYLPTKYQVYLLKERYYDFENALNFLENMRLKELGFH